MVTATSLAPAQDATLAKGAPGLDSSLPPLTCAA
jgi:hypothetical protein